MLVVKKIIQLEGVKKRSKAGLCEKTSVETSFAQKGFKTR